ncbi:conjugative transposon protein TraM [Rapidithrix thailandica]|uniref:Conjugative transposon protein TraM n=1 Tax=Rapidithrix thailandica TaxID=413964 RepID=A0AAW9SH92_9BACT
MNRMLPWLKRYGLLLSGVLLLAGTYGYKYWITGKVVDTPVPYMEPKVELHTQTLPSQIEVFQQQEDTEKQGYWEPRSPVAMDFGKTYPLHKESLVAEQMEPELPERIEPEQEYIQKEQPLRKKLKQKKQVANEGFYTLKQLNPLQEKDSLSQEKFIKIRVNGDQQLKGQSTVSLRLDEDCRIQGQFFPRNTVFYGTAQTAGDRIRISVHRIQALAVDYQVYDHDFTPGLFLENHNPLRQSLEDSGEDLLDEALSEVPFGSVARLGSDLLRSQSRARRVPQAFLPDGYEVYLFPTNPD